MGRKIIWLAVMAMATGLLGACTSDGDISHPIMRKLTWASFINGEDIRANCKAGSLDRLRLVYNADRSHQVRIYDISMLDGQSTGLSREQVLDGGLPIFPADIERWSRFIFPTDSTVSMDVSMRMKLDQALLEDGLTRKAIPVGRRMSSAGFFWIVSGCQNGQTVFNIWEHPLENFDQLNFSKLLFAMHTGGLPVRLPRDDRLIRSGPPGIAPKNGWGDFEDYDLLVRQDRVVLTTSMRKAR